MIEVAFCKGTAMDVINGELFGRIRTRDGAPVRILDWNVHNRYCIAGVVTVGDDEYVRQWTIDGKADFRRNVTTNYDLVIEVEGGES